MDGNKKKTPITDLMAYHLSQLSQELSSKGLLPSSVANDVETSLKAVETYNEIVWPQDSAEAVIKSLESDPEWTNVYHVMNESLEKALHQHLRRLLEQANFVYTDGGIEHACKEFHGLQQPIVTSSFQDELKKLLHNRLSSHIKDINQFAKTNSQEHLEKRLHDLTEKIKNLKAAASSSPATANNSKSVNHVPEIPVTTPVPVVPTATVATPAPAPAPAPRPAPKPVPPPRHDLKEEESQKQKLEQKPQAPPPAEKPIQFSPRVESLNHARLAQPPIESTPEKKKGGFSKMLSSLTKGRPKVAKKKKESETTDTIEVSRESMDSLEVVYNEPDHSREQVAEATTSEFYEQPTKELSPKSPSIPLQLNTTHLSNENMPNSPEKESPKKSPANHAMAALASVMTGSKQQSRNPDDSVTDDLNASYRQVHENHDSPIDSLSSSHHKHPDQSQGESSGIPKSATAKPVPALRPKRDSQSSSPTKSTENTNSRLAIASNEEPVKNVVSVDAPSIPRPVPPKRAVKNEPPKPETMIEPQEKNPSPTANFPPGAPIPVPRTKPVPSARPKSDFVTSEPLANVDVKRPMSSAIETTTDLDSSSHVENPRETEPTSTASQPLQEPPVVPRRIPGVFATHHGAIGALAAAVTGRKSSPLTSPVEQHVPEPEPSQPPNEPSIDNTDNHQHGVSQTQPVEKIEKPPAVAPKAAPPIVSQTPLTFKKKDTSMSGDDKAIEKSSLDWLNQHLASKDIKVEDLYSNLGDGLNLIYALEDATGESVGKYNKRTILPVHKIDNISVALSFLSKKGVDTHFLTPQDLMDGNKGKILTLFNYIIKACP